IRTTKAAQSNVLMRFSFSAWMEAGTNRCGCAGTANTPRAARGPGAGPERCYGPHPRGLVPRHSPQLAGDEPPADEAERQKNNLKSAPVAPPSLAAPEPIHPREASARGRSDTT